MYLNLYLITSMIVGVLRAQEVEILSNILDSAKTAIKVIEADLIFMEDKLRDRNEEVNIQLYYECLCPDCRQFDTTTFIRVYKMLHDYLIVHTYPYGNAKLYWECLYPDCRQLETTSFINEKNHTDLSYRLYGNGKTFPYNNGTVEFKCQHGPRECYGNMLHACAIDILANITASIDFNTCLMDDRNGPGSDDDSADRCGHKLGVNAALIKDCAKGQKGKDLLKYYGDESHKINYKYVPYVLINGVEWLQDTEPDFMMRVCQTFKVKPLPCKENV